MDLHLKKKRTPDDPEPLRDPAEEYAELDAELDRSCELVVDKDVDAQPPAIAYAGSVSFAAPEKKEEPKTPDPVIGEKKKDSADNDEKEQKRINRELKKLSKRENRRQKSKGRFITPMIILGLVVILIIGCIWNVDYCKNNFEVNFYQIESTHVTTDFRIAVISDVHLAEYGEDNEELVSAVKAVHPDLIISAGDLVSYGVENYDSMLSLCTKLSEIAPLYGVMGNHEDEKTYLELDDQMRERFQKAGMTLLINHCEKVKVKNNDIELIGVSGNAEGFDLYGGKNAMKSLDKNSPALRICVAHVPTLFKERLEEYDFDIGIAGHTHGGIVRLPVIGGLYSAEEGFNPDFDGGLYDLKNGATLFVSRGLGNSGKVPRFNNTPELAVIDIRWY